MEPKPKRIRVEKSLKGHKKKRMTKHQQRQLLMWKHVIKCKPCVKAGHKATFTTTGKDPNPGATYICRLCDQKMLVENKQVMGLEEAKKIIP